MTGEEVSVLVWLSFGFAFWQRVCARQVPRRHYLGSGRLVAGCQHRWSLAPNTWHPKREPAGSDDRAWAAGRCAGRTRRLIRVFGEERRSKNPDERSLEQGHV